jgi:uracil-DNA glycosylase
VVIGLGRIGFEAALNAYRELGIVSWKKRPQFKHAARYDLRRLTFISSFHPSQQNTFTGRLTEPMFDRVFREARRAL